MSYCENSTQNIQIKYNAQKQNTQEMSSFSESFSWTYLFAGETKDWQPKEMIESCNCLSKAMFW